MQYASIYIVLFGIGSAVSACIVVVTGVCPAMSGKLLHKSALDPVHTHKYVIPAGMELLSFFERREVHDWEEERTGMVVCYFCWKVGRPLCKM